MIKFDDKELELIANEIYRGNKDATLWDVIVAYFSKKGHVNPCILWILSEFDALRLIARGFDSGHISQVLGISTRNVEEIGKRWGMPCVKQTLDFDPLVVYTKGMAAEEMFGKIAITSPIAPNMDDIRICITNIEKYLEVKNMLDEWENENE